MAAKSKDKNWRHLVKNGPILMNEPPIFLSWKDPEPPPKNDKEKSS